MVILVNELSLLASHVFPLYTARMTLFIFLVVLSLLVLFHECGHFFAAKLFKVKVEEFGFGFPPRAFGKKKGETLYSVNWIPLGGFVRLKGETAEPDGDPTSFAHKPMWQKAIMLVAGVAMNVVLAFLLFWVIYIAGFPQVLQESMKGATVRDRALVIERVMAETPAAGAALEAGQRILEVNGQPIVSFEDFSALVPQEKESELSLKVSNKETKELKVRTVWLPEAKRFGIGALLAETGTVSYGFLRAGAEAVKTTYAATAGILGAFGGLLKSIFIGGKLPTDIAGPVGIAVVTGEIARLGLIHLLVFTALLSLNLAVLNIIPFPALDGGRLLFVIIAKFRGRAVAANVENAFHAVGFLLLMLLVIVVTYRDLLRYGGAIVGGVKGLVGL